MSDDVHNAAHRDLVKALGDEIALKNIGDLGLESADWAEAVDRCASRFPDVPRDEAFRQVGRLIGQRYLSSGPGKLVAQSLQLVERERLFSMVIPAMANRLRTGFEWKWEPSGNGGVVRVVGKRVTPTTTTLGFFETMVEVIGPDVHIRLGKDTPDDFEMIISW
ncbi:MAG: DUF2378 family protein [Myxococcaceae bacterium]